MGPRPTGTADARYVHPLRTFGDLAAYDLEAVVNCRCGRHGTIDAAAEVFRDRPIGGAGFRCTTILPHGQQCTERHVAQIRKRGRDGWDLPDHWRAMMRRHPGARKPDRLRTWRDMVNAGEIAWLSDTGCRAGYAVPMIALDEPPWDRLLDRPIGAIACPTCRRAMLRRHTCGGHGPGGRASLRADDNPAPMRKPPPRHEPVLITGPV